MTPDEVVAYAYEWVERHVAWERQRREEQAPEVAARVLCIDRHDLDFGWPPCRQCCTDVDRALAGQQTMETDR